MHFKNLNLKKCREHLLCNEKIKPISSGRRNFVKAMGLGVVAWNPLFDSVKLLSKDAFEIKKKKRSLLFYRKKKLCWEISDRIFEDGFSTSFKQVGDKYHFGADGLRYVNTNYQFSLKGEIFFDNSCWMLNLNIPELEVETTVDLLKWLDGHVTVLAKTSQNRVLAKIYGEDQVVLDGNFNLSLTNMWQLGFESTKGIILNYQSDVYQTSKLTILPFSASDIPFLDNTISKGTHIVLPTFKKWEQLISTISFKSDLELSVSDTPNLEILLADDRLLWITQNKGDLSLIASGFHGHDFKFDKYFFYAEYVESAAPRIYFSASLPHNGQWLSNQLGTFKFVPSQELPDFEAFGYGNQLNGEVLEPRLHAFKAQTPSGISLSSVYDDSPIIRINPQEPVRRVGTSVLQRVTTPTTDEEEKEEEKTDTQNPVRTIGTIINKQPEDQEPIRSIITTQPELNLEISKIKFRPRRALTVRVLRPEDMILLEFEFHNFNYTNRGQAPFMELDNDSEVGVMIVYFTSQHTLEEAFFESNQLPGTGDNSTVSLPVKHLRARRSRLVYELPAGHDGFPLMMSELLDWSKFKLRVNPRAYIKIPQLTRLKTPTFLTGRTASVKTPSSASYLDTASKDYAIKMVQASKIKASQRKVYDEVQLAKVLQPSEIQTIRPAFNIASIKNVSMKVEPVPETDTSIEAPTLMYISPNQTNDFFHQKELQLREVGFGSKIVSANRQFVSSELRVLDPLVSTQGQIAELWHTTLGVKLNGGRVTRSLADFKTIRALWADDANEKYDNPAGIGNLPFMTSLDASDRHILVHTTSDYSIRDYSPKAVPVNNLMLTSLGAYLDWHAFFDVPYPADNILSIIEWEHLATLGRDHYVKVVREGYLFPFGHRAALVKITERKFHQQTKSAVNRQRMYVVVLEKEVLYSRVDPQNEFIEFPFQAVRINVSKTPDIDYPEPIINVSSSSGGGIRIPRLTSKAGGSENTSYNFYINVGSQGFPFDITATDKEGVEHQVRMPLAFLENRVARDVSLAQQIITKYNENAIYNQTDFAGQEIAYAESLVDGDTTLETDIITFGAQTYPTTVGEDIKFHPKMQEAQVYLKQVDEMTGVRTLTAIGLEDDENDGMVFARVADAVLDFSGGSDKAGGFMSPNISITALSKLQGPVGGLIEDIKKLMFLPDQFFKAMDNLPLAKIFGVIKIFDLLGDLNLGGAFDGLINTINTVKQQIEDIKNQIMYLENLARETNENVDSQVQNLQQQIKGKVDELLNALNGNIPKIPNLKTYVTTEAFYAEYKWQPEFKSSPIVVIEDILQVKVTDPKKALTITTKFEKPFDASKPASLNGSARFEKFGIDLVPLLAVNFNYLEFKTGSSQKTDVKVDIDTNDPIKFQGALSFVNNLQSIIPSTGFSDDGPYIELKPTQVTAGFNISIPNVEVGICMISNMSLGARVTLPFTGAPLTMGFNFCTRENPFLLTISCFGGGGFFMMVTTLKGLQSIEAAFEFGAAMSLNVGVASGGVSAMGGFYYKFELVDVTVGEEVEQIGKSTLSGYLRINGHLSVLGMITVSLEFYLAFTAVFSDGGNKVEKIEGFATVKVKVEVLFFSKTVKVTVRRELKGADADPKFIEMIDQDDWQEYCLAFAS